MVVLTYHRIPARAGGSDFYAVDANTLATHLDVLRSHGYEPGSFDNISAGTGRSFVLTFDDATIDHIETAAPLLESNNVRGIFFIPTAKLGKPGRLTRAQMTGLSQRGHEIGSHSHEHLRLDRMPQAEIRTQLENSRLIIAETTGKQPRSFAAPGGYTNADVRSVARECGMTIQRTMRWGVNKRLDPLNLETVPVNAGMSAQMLGRILSGERLLLWRLAYGTKETMKSLLPLSLYEQIRKTMTKRGN